jgi:hypothetical protein
LRAVEVRGNGGRSSLVRNSLVRRDMRILGLLVAAALAAFTMLGCFARSEGQLGHASFSYEECLFGCTVTDNSMAAGGASAVIQVQLSSGYSFAQVRSSNPSVAQFNINASGVGGGVNVGVVAGTPGQTQLQLVDANGKLVDQVNVNVAAVAKLAVTQGWSGAAPLVLESSSQSFHVITQDGNARTLIGTGSVAFDVVGALHKIDGVFGGDIQGFAGVPGSGSVTARCATASSTLPVTVVPLTAIGGVTATVKPNTTQGTQTYGNVDVVANSAGGSVYGATCHWTTSDPSVTVNQQSATTLESAPKASTSFLLAAPGTFTATCTLGAVSASVSLHR